VAKANYHQIRRQKELARKTRKQEKQQKRQAAKVGEPTASDPSTDEPTLSETMAPGPENTVSVDESTGSAGGQGPTGS
jgi:hypothetical protein